MISNKLCIESTERNFVCLPLQTFRNFCKETYNFSIEKLMLFTKWFPINYALRAPKEISFVYRCKPFAIFAQVEFQFIKQQLQGCRKHQPAAAATETSMEGRLHKIWTTFFLVLQLTGWFRLQPLSMGLMRLLKSWALEYYFNYHFWCVETW